MVSLEKGEGQVKGQESCRFMLRQNDSITSLLPLLLFPCLEGKGLLCAGAFSLIHEA